MARRRDLFRMAAVTPFAFLPVAAKSLDNVTLGPSQAKLTREPFGDLRIYFDGPTDQLTSMTAGSLKLNPGATPHEPHRHPEEEFLLVTEGTGEISIDGKITRVAPGSMMYCAANKLHGIVNTGKTALLFYFYKWRK